MKLTRKLRIYGSALVVSGLLGVLPAFYYSWRGQLASDNLTVSAASALPEQSQGLISDIPTHLTINSRRISLPVAKGDYSPSSKEWTLSDTTALYATISSPINNKGGGTLVYGHDTQAVFRPLHGLEKGDKAIIITKNGYKFVYEFTSSRLFDPSDSSILSYEGAPRLYLQTCFGIWSQDRRIFTFELVSYEKIQLQSVSSVLKNLTTKLISPSAGVPPFNVILKPS